MGFKDDLVKNADDIVAAKREERDGRKVPETKDVAFLGAAVNLDAVFLYADLRDSTTLATKNRKAAADVFQMFLSTMTRVIKEQSGEVRSFDGDRVMAVFIGDDRCDIAAKCALKMHWAFKEIVRPKLKNAWPQSLSGYELNYCTGIDAGEIIAVRGGVRNDSDLVWVGRAPNLAAKLSAMNTGYPTYITGAVFDKLTDSARYAKDPRRLMWEKRSWTTQNDMTIYRSNFWWPIS